MTKRIFLLLAFLAAGSLIWWAIHQKMQAPEIPFASVRRETLVSNLITNGKVEPVAWQDIRVDNQGLVNRGPRQRRPESLQGSPAGTDERTRTGRGPARRRCPRRAGARGPGDPETGRQSGRAGAD